jgi:PAS domain S-box-containing protein/diguanylate cyclase (GGDEF)-like protein
VTIFTKIVSLFVKSLAGAAPWLNWRKIAASQLSRLPGGPGYGPSPWLPLAALSQDGVMVMDLGRPSMPVIYVNAAFERITGYAAKEAIGKSPRHLWGSDRSQPELAVLVAAIRNREEGHVTFRNYRKDGSLFWNELRVAPILDRRHKATHYLGLIRDVTDRRSPALHLGRTGLRDPVTGLFDRSRFKPELQALIDAWGDGAVLLVKLDVMDFHEFNTGFGYHTGDALLREIADRLGRVAGGLIGRTSADEFVIALWLPSPSAARAIVEEMLEALEGPYTLPAAMLNVRFATGYTIGVKQHTALRLLQEGAAALHQAKRSGQRIVEFDQTTDAELRRRRRFTSDLQRAIANQEFRLHFQPKVELSTGRLVGAEAILHWPRATFDTSSLSLAYDTGLILPLRQWTLRKLAAFAARCNRGRHTRLPIAFRIADTDLGRSDLLRRLQEVTLEFEIEPAWITLGLAQDVFVQRAAELLPVLVQIREMGFGISIENFGIHFASTGRLNQLHVSELKIHGGFVRGMLGNRYHRVAVESVIRLGEALGVDVIAKGVDTAAVAKVLRDLNCPIGQGLFLGEPMPEEAFLALPHS